MHTFKSSSNTFRYSGHIQIAQVPDRFEPDTPGEINYPYVFQQLEKHNYQGWIGLEYFHNPSVTTEGQLKWMEKYGYPLTSS